MNKICLIGNTGILNSGKDGQTRKVRQYLECLEKEGYNPYLIELGNSKSSLLKIIFKIIKSFKNSDVIILITAVRGAKALLPFLICINKLYKKKIVFPFIGTSFLHSKIDKMETNKQFDLLALNDINEISFSRKLKRILSNVTYLLPETDGITTIISKLSSNTNIHTLTNFRFFVPVHNCCKITDKIKFVFYSRVTIDKGIFTLLSILSSKEFSGKISLDIIGDKYLSKEEDRLLTSYLNTDLKYIGSIPFDKSQEVLGKYDMMIFPTEAAGEGTPGVIVESLLAGTPVLTSNFPQARYILEQNIDSVFYNFLDANDLKEKVLMLINNKDLLVNLKLNAYKNAQKFTYEFNRKKFIKYVCCEDECYD